MPVNFYLHKHLSQWADGTYASRQATLATYGGRSDFLKEVYEGSLASAYIEWGNAWQNVLYLGMLMFCIATVRKRRPGNGSANAAANDDFRFRNICLYTYTGLIAVAGRFPVPHNLGSQFPLYFRVQPAADALLCRRDP